MAEDRQPMNSSFARALRFAWPYRGRMAISLACGVVVAIFWGANISAIYPILTVLLDKKTLSSWVDDRIVSEEAQVAMLRDKVDDYSRRIDEANQQGLPVSALQGELARRSSEAASRAYWLSWYRWIQPFLHQYTPNDSFKTLCLLIGIMLLGVVFKGIINFFQEYLAGSVVQLSLFDLRRMFFRRTVALDLNHFSSSGSHEVMSRFTNDVETLSSGLRALLGKVMLEPLKALTCLLFACFFNWRLTLLTLFLFPAVAVILGVIGRYLKKVSRRNLESMSRIYKILQETFQNIRVVKAFTMERYERRRFFREIKQYYRESMKLIRTDSLSSPLIEVFGVSAIACALLAGSYLVMTGKTHVLGMRLTYDPLEEAMLLTFYGLIAGICDPLRKVFSVYGRVQRGIAASERIFNAYDRGPEVTSRPKAAHLSRHHQSIEFSDIHFGYNAESEVIKGLSLRVEFGETIAVVGATGSGKSSLINLLPRFYDPCVGAVYIDGCDLRDVSIPSLREQIGVVTQQQLLFDDTVLNNISYGCGNVDPELVKSAAKAAHAHTFIESFPEGYQTLIGEGGARMSGGQRQRLCLARAILRDPSILILDEATSSIDVESEALIHEALRTFTKGRTTFIVTHRLSTLDIADRIAVMGDGVLEAVGTHQELLAKSSTYRRLFDVHSQSA